MKTQVRAWLAIVAGGISSLCAQDPVDGLRGYWPFDGNLSEKLEDYHAVNRGNVRASYVSGRFGQALRFDGKRDLVEVAARNDRAFDSYHASTSVWIKVEAGGTILDKGSSSWSLSYVAETGTLEFGAYWGVDSFHGYKTSGGLGLDDGEWHHVVCMGYKTDEGPVFVDGQAVKLRVAGVVGVQGSRFPLAIGGHPERSRKHGPFTGSLDELMVWDRSLTLAEVEMLWNEGRGVTLPDLLSDEDADGLPDAWETRHGLNVLLADDTADVDLDGLTNLQEYQRGTHPQWKDTDHDGLDDGMETDTGLWEGAEMTGTSPLIADTDGDGLDDGRESATGVFVSKWELGTDPLKADTDGDGFDDGGEISLGSDPTESLAIPSLDRDLVAYHPFDTNLQDQRGGESGEWIGTPAFADNLFDQAVFGEALVFNGESAVRLPERPEFVSGPYTVSMWYRIKKVPDVTFGSHTLAAYGRSGPWQLDYQASGGGHLLGRGLVFKPETLDPLAQRVVTTERDLLWHHVAAIYDPESDQTSVYLDGVAQPVGTEGAHYSPIVSESIGFVLGGRPSEEGEVSSGLIGGLDDLAVWRRALDPAEIQVIHAQGTENVSLGDSLLRQDALPEDGDQDGLPDRWELAVGLQPSVDDREEDLDGDGLTNAAEHAARTHPGKVDTDDDGVPDGAETGTRKWVSLEDQGTDPNHPDSDRDGLQDGDERKREAQGADPNEPDTDADGIADGIEVRYGSDPANAEAVPALSAGLLAYLPLDERLNDPVGRSEGRWGNPDKRQWEPGKFGQAARFASSTQFVDIEGGVVRNVDFGSESFTVSLWFQEMSSKPSSGVLLGQGGADGWEIRIQSYNEVRVDAFANFVGRPRASVDQSDFNHLVFVVDRQLNRTLLVLNGKKLSPTFGQHPEALEPFIETAGEPLRLGNSIRRSGNSDFTGLIDEVAIWRRPLADSEIAALFESGESLSTLAGLATDTDNDGMPDLREQFAGTDPAQASEVLQVTAFRRVPEGVLLEWPTQPGRGYHVEYSPTVSDARWQTLTPAPIDEGTFLDQAPARLAQPTGYYRVVAQVPFQPEP